jgi:hypothetical protein
MKKITFIFVCLLLMCGTVFAATAEENRGTEEEKRKSLAPTEVQQLPAAPARESGLSKEKQAFLEEVYNKKVSSLGDACRALGIMLGKEEQFVQENFFPPSMKAPFHLQEPLRKGVVAYMLCKALHIKGGLWLRLLGVNQRYALRELVYEGVMFSGNVQDFMSGRELISTLTQAADYLARSHDK